MIDNDYTGDPRYIHITKQGKVIDSVRPLRNKYSDAVIRDKRLIDVLDKAGKTEYMSSTVSNRNPFGIPSWIFNQPERMPEAHFSKTQFLDSCKIHGCVGTDGYGRRTFGYVSLDAVTKNQDIVDKYKCLIATSFDINQKMASQRVVCKSHEICTDSFLLLGVFDTEQETINCDKYLGTKFASCMLYQRKIQQTNSKKLFEYLPLQDFTEEWTDEKLYRKYGLDKADIDFIEENFKT